MSAANGEDAVSQDRSAAVPADHAIGKSRVVVIEEEYHTSTLTTVDDIAGIWSTEGWHRGAWTVDEDGQEFTCDPDCPGTAPHLTRDEA